MSLGEKELRSRSQVIQRNFPRPLDINIVLRPANTDPPLTDLQKVYMFSSFVERFFQA